MSEDCGLKLGDLDRTQADTGTASKLRTEKPAGPLGDLKPELCNIIQQFSQFSVLCMPGSCLLPAQSPICSMQHHILFLNNGLFFTAFLAKFYQTWRWASQEVVTYNFGRLGSSSDWQELQLFLISLRVTLLSFMCLPPLETSNLNRWVAFARRFSLVFHLMLPPWWIIHRRTCSGDTASVIRLCKLQGH